MLKITGTFLDEISWDIPHHNWGVREWDRDFRSMKAIGIDTVIMIRCGLRQYLAYPSEVLMEKENCLAPYSDLPDMFLTLAEKYGMDFYFGTYDSARPVEQLDFQYESGAPLHCSAQALVAVLLCARALELMGSVVVVHGLSCHDEGPETP